MDVSELSEKFALHVSRMLDTFIAHGLIPVGDILLYSSPITRENQNNHSYFLLNLIIFYIFASV
jgi:hypothetical protein